MSAGPIPPQRGNAARGVPDLDATDFDELSLPLVRVRDVRWPRELPKWVAVRRADSYSGIFSVITASLIAARLRHTSTSVALPTGVVETSQGNVR